MENRYYCFAIPRPLLDASLLLPLLMGFHAMARAAFACLHGCVSVRIDQFSLSCVAHWRICAVRTSPLVRTLPFPCPASASARASASCYIADIRYLFVPTCPSLRGNCLQGTMTGGLGDGRVVSLCFSSDSLGVSWREDSRDMFTRIGRAPGVLHDGSGCAIISFGACNWLFRY
jgi:hypothetical protein